MGKVPTNTYEILSHLFSYLSQDQSVGNQVIKQCITEMMNARPKIYEIVENIKPYQDDAILVLIEALNLPSNKTFSLQPNAIYVLEKIGNYEAVSLILENFNDYIDRFNFSLTKMLTTIAAREGEPTKKMIIEKYIKFLVDQDNPSIDQRKNKEDKQVVSVLDSLKRMKKLDDLRLPGILEKYVGQTRENSDAHKLALFALARADEKKAMEIINENSKVSPLPTTGIPRQQIRTVYNQVENDEDLAFITLFTKKQGNSTVEETPYLFEFEKPMIYFLEKGTQDIQSTSLSGRADNQNDAINAACQYLEIKLHRDHLPNTKLQECHGILARFFNFEGWGFEQSYIRPKYYPTIIYDSEWCRIRFAFDGSGDQHDHRTHLHVYYGRLHASSADSFMVLNKEQHWCWHSVEYALNFLDGLSPEAAIKVEYCPKVKEQYRQSNLAKKLTESSQAEWMSGMESEIWKQYGQRLFELFDLRRPELWEQYANFIKEFHRIKKSESYGYPSYDKIC
jgi:hypothetical protein